MEIIQELYECFCMYAIRRHPLYDFRCIWNQNNWKTLMLVDEFHWLGHAVQSATRDAFGRCCGNLKLLLVPSKNLMQNTLRVARSQLLNVFCFPFMFFEENILCSVFQFFVRNSLIYIRSMNFGRYSVVLHCKKVLIRCCFRQKPRFVRPF